MSNNKVLLFTVVSLLLLVAVIRYGAREAPSVNGTVNDLPHATQIKSTNPKLETTKTALSNPAPQPSVGLSVEDQKKLDLFREVVRSGKDNDPRVDKELKNLSPELKQALESEYQSLPKEQRNGRGFVAFLIGRSITEPSDVEFLEQVVKEEPCLSLQNCEVKTPMFAEADEHAISVTLNYPQIVAARMLKQNLPKASPEMKSRISQALASSRY